MAAPPHLNFAALGTSAQTFGAFLDQSGAVVAKRVAHDFGMSQQQLADTVGLAPQTIYKPDRARAPKTQSRMKEMLEIVVRVSDWAGGLPFAMAWYKAQPIPAFGDRTAESLVKSGDAAAVRDYLDAIAMGGYA